MSELASVCVFCGSNMGRRPAYRQAVEAVARAFAHRGITLVYGGASKGLMGLLADAALDAGAEVIGIIPRYLVDVEVAHRSLTQLHVVDGMGERQMLMGELSDGYLTLPGGFGTLDELFEMAVRTQLHLEAKPSGILDVAGYYGDLRAFLEHTVAEGLLRRENLDALLFDDDVDRLLDRMATWEAPAGAKWIE